MNKILIRGIVYAYVNGKMQRIKIEGEPKLFWNDDFQMFDYWLEAKCPFDRKKLYFEIKFEDTEKSLITRNVGSCEHFSPPKDALLKDWERNIIEAGIFYPDLNKNQFAKLMDLKIEWRGEPGNRYWVFVDPFFC